MNMKEAIKKYKENKEWETKTKEATSVLVKYTKRNKKDMMYMIELYSNNKEYELAANWDFDHEDLDADIDSVKDIIIYGRIV